MMKKFSPLYNVIVNGLKKVFFSVKRRSRVNNAKYLTNYMKNCSLVEINKVVEKKKFIHCDEWINFYILLAWYYRQQEMGCIEFKRNMEFLETILPLFGDETKILACFTQTGNHMDKIGEHGYASFIWGLMSDVREKEIALSFLDLRDYGVA
jgi:hypothetical protein